MEPTGHRQWRDGRVDARSGHHADFRWSISPRWFHDARLSLRQRAALDGGPERLDRDQQRVRALCERLGPTNRSAATRACAVGADTAICTGTNATNHAGADTADRPDRHAACATLVVEIEISRARLPPCPTA